MDAIVGTLAAANPDDINEQVRRAQSSSNLGFVATHRTGDSEAGLKYFREAIDINRECLKKEPENDLCKRELANSLGQLAGAELILGHLVKALELYRDEEKVRDTFSQELRNSRESRRELAGLYEKMAEVYLRMNDLEEGRRLYDECSALRDGWWWRHRTSGRPCTTWPGRTTTRHSCGIRGAVIRRRAAAAQKALALD